MIGFVSTLDRYHQRFVLPIVRQPSPFIHPAGFLHFTNPFLPAAPIRLMPSPFFNNYQPYNIPHQSSEIDNRVSSLLKKLLLESQPAFKMLDQSELSYLIRMKVKQLSFQDKLDILDEYFLAISQDGNDRQGMAQTRQGGIIIGLLRRGEIVNTLVI